MSEPLRIALVAEGPTDRIVLEAALRAMLSAKPFILIQLQPEGSVAFGETGSGWVGVYRWCKQAAQRGGGGLASDRLLFQRYDLLVLQLDADVAGKRYADGSIAPLPADGALPCELPCPPASATTDALRRVLLSWCGETGPPRRTVTCIPSKNTEAWVMAALFPADSVVASGIECFRDPETWLLQRPLRGRVRKSVAGYQARSDDIEQAWSRLAADPTITETRRFQEGVLEVLATL